MIVPALYGEKLENKKVACHLCPVECRLTEGKLGVCKARFNSDGDLVTSNYGELVTLASDPIEKKPLYHFYPGTQIVSTGANCCNLGCRHCQNWQISKEEAGTFYVSPEDLVRNAERYDSIGVAFTYTEPVVWFEYIMDTAPLLNKEGLKVVMVSNGYINPKPLEQFLEVTDAWNIDLKGMNPQFYKRVCKGKLEPVLEAIRMVGNSAAHLEITNLIIPHENDSDEDIRKLVDFVASVSDMIPLHFSAYYPTYKMDHERTPVSTLLRAREIAQKSLKYVYLGNVATSEGSNTFCPNCGQLLIKRTGYMTTASGIEHGICTNCGFATGIRQ